MELEGKKLFTNKETFLGVESYCLGYRERADMTF